ncbi:methyl-accepting chemotaxis protein [Clostridium algidicarnis]|uniref:methyl-accepting chemotaxis protein n=1 Tax=Clostridium algidicarnis TaxID=37659 RepID=UPI001626CF90|nr:methyl-accepting chemotaxis protein [Clostridium algidicarnis]MBB6696762.1 chemotaxis protein [Clostridium algidicarnis]MBU3204034.1 chemotaxis protein [Clostridium algidicarnis]MBU3212188.1 chemotaxis protein [Clostridium algidicarnis]MBU3221307.1 chemotaxis protein [Clostridium algidicarnis]
MGFFKKNDNKTINEIKLDSKDEYNIKEDPIPENHKSENKVHIAKEISILKDNIEYVAATSSDINSSINQMSAGNISQSNDLAKASDILSDFNKDMEELAVNVVNVQIKVMDSDKNADDGLETIKTLDSSLGDLEDALSISNSTVNDLVGKLESVNTITDSISQIASQTNLLALNAAIEAARAGDAGKGFSVVAGEVRKLAENSKIAVQNITKILEEIKVDILNTSSAMSSGNNALFSQKSTIKQTKDTFLTIKSELNESVNEIEKCIVNLTNSSEKKDIIISSIDDISSLSEENSSLSEEIVATMQSQDSTIQSINEGIINIENSFKE